LTIHLMQCIKHVLYDFLNGVVQPCSQILSYLLSGRTCDFKPSENALLHTRPAGTSPCANYSQCVVNRVLRGNTEYPLLKYVFIGHLKEKGTPLDVSVMTEGSGSLNDIH
jgi:hypothetical protein